MKDPITIQAVVDQFNVNNGGYPNHYPGGYTFEGTLGLPAMMALPEDLCGARVEVTFRLLAKGSRVVPWKVEDVPVGCRLREKAKPDTIWFVTHADQLNPDASVWSGNRGWCARGLATGYEHSTDGGKTWRPAGKTEEVWS